MLRFYHQLFFPALNRVDDVNFKVWPTSSISKTTDVYKLDWSGKDKSCKKKHDIWINRHNRSNIKIPFLDSLPNKYDTWIQNLEFSIPTHYMKEIRESTRKGLMEWTRERNFDSRVREVCLEPAISFLRVAFELIADCTYDRKENYFYRGNDKLLISTTLLYKFWTHQTSKDAIWYNSGCDRIKGFNKESEILVDEFLTLIKEHEIEFEKVYESIKVEI